MSDKKTGTVILGTQAAPLALGATGGASDVGTYTHGLGKKALRISVVDPVNGVAIADADITVTQPDADTIVFTNTTMGALDAIAIIDFDIATPQLSGKVPASDVVLT